MNGVKLNSCTINLLKLSALNFDNSFPKKQISVTFAISQKRAVLVAVSVDK